MNQGSFNTFYCIPPITVSGETEWPKFIRVRACRLPEFRIGEVWQPRTWKESRSENTRLEKEQYRTATHYSWTWRLGPDATYKIIKSENVSEFVPLLASV